MDYAIEVLKSVRERTLGQMRGLQEREEDLRAELETVLGALQPHRENIEQLDVALEALYAQVGKEAVQEALEAADSHLDSRLRALEGPITISADREVTREEVAEAFGIPSSVLGREGDESFDSLASKATEALMTVNEIRELEGLSGSEGEESDEEGPVGEVPPNLVVDEGGDTLILEPEEGEPAPQVPDSVVRAWAAEQGIPVKNRGAVSLRVWELYQEAQRQLTTSPEVGKEVWYHRPKGGRILMAIYHVHEGSGIPPLVDLEPSTKGSAHLYGGPVRQVPYSYKEAPGTWRYLSRQEDEDGL